MSEDQRAASVAVLTDIVKENVDHKFMLKQTCAEGYCSFYLIAQSLFNFFAKNELKLINQCEVELHVKMNRSLRKLSSNRQQNTSIFLVYIFI